MMDIRNEVKATLPGLREARRALHRIPELGYREHKTHDYLIDKLSALAPDRLETLAGTGIKAVFFAKDAPRTTAFRADIDALPVTERTGLPFASEHPGAMHACGHDSHMAAALATASLVAKNRERLHENVVFLFQPAEEGEVGAARMIADGALEDPHVDRIFGMHVFPGIPLGSIGVRAGSLMARASSIDLIVRGKSAHGAKPPLGCDAIVAAAQLVTMLETIISRRVDPFESAVLTIGKICGGTKRNIICPEVKLECTMRTFSDEAYETMLGSIRGMLKAVESAFGVECELRFECEDYLGVVNDASLAEEYRALAGNAAVEAPMVCISEDFSFYQRKTKGLFVFTGIGDASPLHADDLFFDEEAVLPYIEMNMRLLGL